MGSDADEGMVVVTVVTRSHVGDARVLASMLRRWNPGVECRALVVDAGLEERKRLRAVEGLEWVGMEELGLEQERSFCFQYTAFELCNALKPHLMRWARARTGGGQVLYLDSDIGVFGALDGWREGWRGADVLLTPHVTVDYPADGCIPKRWILGFVGVYNAGVVGVGTGPGSDRFLDWWAGEMRHGSLDAPTEGLFVDQKVLDFVPGLFAGTSICRHPGVNLGHFNLHARRLERRDGHWWVDGERLLLGHFTGVDPDRLEFRPPLDRPLIRQQPLLKDWLREYVEEWRRNGAVEERRTPYGLGLMADGIPILPETRRAYREAWMSGRLSEDPYADPHWMKWNRNRSRVSRIRSVWNRWVTRAGGWITWR